MAVESLPRMVVNPFLTACVVPPESLIAGPPRSLRSPVPLGYGFLIRTALRTHGDVVVAGTSDAVGLCEYVNSC